MTVPSIGTQDDPIQIGELPVFRERGELTPEQHAYLMNPIKAARIASRNQGGKSLSYLESWDVRAHLIRIFGFGNFDAHVVNVEHIYTRDVEVGQNKSPGIECAYLVVFTLVVRDKDGRQICSFTESAVGSASGSSGYGDLHDNAVKQAASDALKRCAINLGTQFGLSLYDNGRREDVVRQTLVAPKGANATPAQEAAGGDLTDEQRETLSHSLGATEIDAGPDEAPAQTAPDPADDPWATKADTPEQAAEQVDKLQVKGRR